MPDGGDDDRRREAAEPPAPQPSEKTAPPQPVVGVVGQTATFVAAVAAAVAAIVAAFALDGWLTGVPALAGTVGVAVVFSRSSAGRGSGASSRTTDSTDDSEGLVRASVAYRCFPDHTHPDRWLCRIRTEVRATRSGVSRFAFHRPRGPGGAPPDLRFESDGHQFVDTARGADPDLRWIDLGIPLAENRKEKVTIVFDAHDRPDARSSSIQYRVAGPTERLQLAVYLPAQLKPRRCAAYEKPPSGRRRQLEPVFVEAPRRIELVVEDPHTDSTYILEWTR